VNQQLRAEITERERVEEQLKISLDQLRALAGRLQSVREEERTSIAREIHDELGQSCTAIKMDLALIGRKTTKTQSQLRAKVDSATQVVDNMIGYSAVKSPRTEPRVLDDLGLTAALELASSGVPKPYRDSLSRHPVAGTDCPRFGAVYCDLPHLSGILNQCRAPRSRHARRGADGKRS